MIGEFVGHYRIDAQLGAGAMGVVYRAYDTRLHRTVAIKRLQDPSTEQSGVKLLEGARAASTLNHPNICTIHEVGDIDGHAYIVMEHIDGSPLSRLIPKGGRPLETVARVRKPDRNMVWTRTHSDLHALHDDPRVEANLTKMRRQ